MTLTEEQFNKAREAGFSVEQIVGFEEKRTAEKPKKSTSFLPRERDVEKLIEERRTSTDILMEEYRTPYTGGFGKRALKTGVTMLKTAAVPFQLAESGVAGLGLGLQKGSLKEGLQNSVSGFTGKKAQEAGDIIRTTGVGGKYNEFLATGIGFTASMVAPIKAVRKANKILRGISKSGDKALLKASANLVNTTDDALKIVGGRLNDAYEPIKNIKIKPDKVFDVVSDLPDTIVKHLEEGLLEEGLVGKLDDYLSDFDMSKARKLKQLLAELQPTSFGKAEKGAVERILDKKLVKAYGTIKDEMQKTLSSLDLDKPAKILSEADSAYSETRRASNYVRKILTESTLRKQTKVGSLAQKLTKTGEPSLRIALTTIKKASVKTAYGVNKSVEALERYNRIMQLTQFSEAFARAVGYGGVGGLAAGKIIQAID